MDIDIANNYLKYNVIGGKLPFNTLEVPYI